jgi:hypothetical protein
MGSLWCCQIIASCNSSSTSFLILRIAFSVFASPSNPLSLVLSIADSMISLVPTISCRWLSASTLPLSLPGV